MMWQPTFDPSSQSFHYQQLCRRQYRALLGHHPGHPANRMLHHPAWDAVTNIYPSAPCKWSSFPYELCQPEFNGGPWDNNLGAFGPLTKQFLRSGQQKPGQRGGKTMTGVTKSPMPKPGDIYAGRFNIIAKVGQGGFSNVFSALDSNSKTKIAIKIRKGRQSDSHSMAKDVDMMKLLAGTCKHVCHLIYSGICPGGLEFIAMTLLDRSLHQLRSQQTGDQFSLSTALRCGKQMLQCLQDVHNVDHVYGDIHLWNVMIGFPPDRHRIVHLIDFGKARQFCDDWGEMLPCKRRKNGSFGTYLQYSTINSMMLQEESRADDLQTLCYVVLDLCGVKLPWLGVFGRQAVLHKKKGADVFKLAGSVSPSLATFWKHVSELQEEEKPDYGLLHSLLDDVILEKGILESDPYDWETKA